MKLWQGLGGLGPIVLVMSVTTGFTVFAHVDQEPEATRIDVGDILNVAENIAQQAASHVAQGATTVAHSIDTDTIINGVGNVAVAVAANADSTTVLNVVDHVVSDALTQVPGGQALQIAQQTIIAPATTSPTPQEVAQAVAAIAISLAQTTGSVASSIASVAKPAASSAINAAFSVSYALVTLLKDLINPQKIFTFAKQELTKMYQIITARLALHQQK